MQELSVPVYCDSAISLMSEKWYNILACVQIVFSLNAEFRSDVVFKRADSVMSQLILALAHLRVGYL